MSRFHMLRVHGSSGAVDIPGLETGPMQLVAVRDEPPYALVYEAGSHYWSGIGQPWQYSGAKWIVYQLLDVSAAVQGDAAPHPGVAFVLRGLPLIEMPARTSADQRNDLAGKALAQLHRMVPRKAEAS